MNASPAAMLLGAPSGGQVAPEVDGESCVPVEFTTVLATAAAPQALGIALGTEAGPEDLTNHAPDGMQSESALAFLASLLGLEPAGAQADSRSAVADGIAGEASAEILTGRSVAAAAAASGAGSAVGNVATPLASRSGPQAASGESASKRSAGDMPRVLAGVAELVATSGDVAAADSAGNSPGFDVPMRSAFGGSEAGTRSVLELTSSLSQVVASAVRGQVGASGAAAADVATDAQATVRHGVGARGWADEVGSRLVLMSLRGQHEGSLRLTPEHLGPLEVRIKVGQERTDVWFGAQHADTRAALNEAMPRLREMFAASGLALGHAGVSQDMPRQEARASGSPRSSGATFASPVSADVPEPGVQRQVVRGLLDAWA